MGWKVSLPSINSRHRRYKILSESKDGPIRFRDKRVDLTFQLKVRLEGRRWLSRRVRVQNPYRNCRRADGQERVGEWVGFHSPLHLNRRVEYVLVVGRVVCVQFVLRVN